MGRRLEDGQLCSGEGKGIVLQVMDMGRPSGSQSAQPSPVRVEALWL